MIGLESLDKFWIKDELVHLLDKWKAQNVWIRLEFSNKD